MKGDQDIIDQLETLIAAVKTGHVYHVKFTVFYSTAAPGPVGKMEYSAFCVGAEAPPSGGHYKVPRRPKR